MENVLAKASFLKLLKKEILNGCFQKRPTYGNRTPPLNNLQEFFYWRPSDCKQISSNQIRASVNVLNTYNYLITSYQDISGWNKISLKKYIKTKICRKETSKRFLFLKDQKLIKKRHQSEHHFLSFKNIKISMSQQRQFLIHQNCIKEVHGNDVN